MGRDAAERLPHDSNASKVQNYEKNEMNEMGMWERTLSEGEINGNNQERVYPVV